MNRQEIAKQIAHAALEIGAIKLQPDEPFQWASGFSMPIYNDNRMLLGSFPDRQLVAEGLKAVIEEEGLDFDYLAGTTTSGIAPAATLAMMLGKPLVILQEGTPFKFDLDRLSDLYGVEIVRPILGSVDAIASTTPWAIPMGASLANESDKPFMYVRSEKKDHGLKQQIEGIYHDGQKVILVDYYDKKNHLSSAINVLESSGLVVQEKYAGEVNKIVARTDVSGKRIVQIEDLVSTGGSYLKEVAKFRELGAEVNNTIAIFSYGLKKAQEKINEFDPNFGLSPILTYDLLMNAVAETGYFNDTQMNALREWRQDPFNWGEKHGFPPVKKN